MRTPALPYHELPSVGQYSGCLNALHCTLEYAVAYAATSTVAPCVPSWFRSPAGTSTNANA